MNRKILSAASKIRLTYLFANKNQYDLSTPDVNGCAANDWILMIK